MKKQILLAAIIALTVVTAEAAERGAFAGAGVGLNTLNDSQGNSGYSGTGLSMGLVARYNINRYIGFEGALNLFGLTGWSAGAANLVAIPLSISVIGYAPVHEKIDIFGKLGTSYTTLNFSGAAGQPGSNLISSNTSMYGFGVEFSTGEKETYRIGIDHYDLSVVPGTSVSTNYLNITGTTRF